MSTTYLAVTLLAVIANIYAATNDFTRVKWVLANMTRLGIPEPWLFPLGALKMAGALGLLAGIFIPWVGVAAGIGLVVFFIGAIITAIRAGWPGHLPYPILWLALSAGALACRIQSWPAASR